MINVEGILKLLECAILTGFIKDGRGVNFLIIANAESGKSELIQLLRHYPQTIYTNDLSTKPFIDEIMPKFERDEVSYLLIPDFITPLSHRKASETLIPILNGFLAEGMKDVKFYGLGRTFSKAVRGCLITAVTKEIFDNRVKSFRDNGFLSRILPITYEYSNLTQRKIHEFIKNNEYQKPLKLNRDFSEFKLKSFVVEIPKDISEKLELISDYLVDKNKSYSIKIFGERRFNEKLELSRYGFRMHKQLRTLIQGIALYNVKHPNPNNKVIVTENDFNDFKELIKFINFDFTKI